MGIKAVYQGIGKGSMFGHGRFFGIHNPIGSKIGKALDPYINLHTLARLCESNDKKVNRTVISNISKRLQGPLDKNTIKRIFLMDHKILSEVLSKDLYSHPWLHQPIIDFISQSGMPNRRADRNKALPPETYRKALIRLTSYPKNAHSEIAKIAFFTLDKDLTSEELEKIARLGPSSSIVSYLMDHKFMRRSIAAYLANASYEDDSINRMVFDSLVPMMTEDELYVMSRSKCDAILQNVCAHPRSTPDIAANALHTKMRNSGIPFWNSMGLIDRQPCRDEIDEACIFILPRKQGIKNILNELKNIDPILGGAMIERFHSNRPLMYGLDHKQFVEPSSSLNSASSDKKFSMDPPLSRILDRKSDPATFAKAIRELVLKNSGISAEQADQVGLKYDDAVIEEAAIYILLRTNDKNEIMSELMKADRKIAESVMDKIRTKQFLTMITEPRENPER